jgi:hypothetical protein
MVQILVLTNVVLPSKVLKSNPITGLDRPIGFSGGWSSQISRQSAHAGGKVFSPTARPPLPPRNYSWYSFLLWAGYLSRYSDWLRAGRSGDRIPVEARFFAHVQTGHGAHPASCTIGTGSFPGVKRSGRGAVHPPPSSAEVENE